MFLMISANANNPIATIGNDIPSSSSSKNAKRITPVCISVPMVPISTPIKHMPIPLKISPVVNMPTLKKPSAINAQYSAGPNFNASTLSIGDNVTNSIVANTPAIKELKPAANIAGPAFPFFVILFPSMQVITALDSPGVFSNIAVVLPPYCDP